MAMENPSYLDVQVNFREIFNFAMFDYRRVSILDLCPLVDLAACCPTCNNARRN
jgi:hypothetical protein